MSIKDATHPESFVIGQITQELAMVGSNPDTLLNIAKAMRDFYSDRLTRNEKACAKVSAEIAGGYLAKMDDAIGRIKRADDREERFNVNYINNQFKGAQ